MSYAQRFLNQFLQAEIYHSLGSYRSCVNVLEKIQPIYERQKKIQSIYEKEKEDARKEIDAAISEDLFQSMVDYNKELDKKIHSSEYHPEDDSRHPKPPAPELKDLWIAFSDDDISPNYKWVICFYKLAMDSLNNQNRMIDFLISRPIDYYFGQDLQLQKNRAIDELIQAQLSRFDRRLKKISDAFPDTFKQNISDRDLEFHWKYLINDSFRNNNPERKSPHRFIMKMLIETHYRMHYVEHLRLKAFENVLRKRHELKEETDKQIKFCIEVNTFIFSLMRTAPWIFAEDKNECELVQKKYRSPEIQSMPPFCMWIAQQISLLALYRRAYCYCLLGGKNRKSFNDYLKVQRLARISRRALSKRMTNVYGANHFLMALDALCEFRMGELYRIDHAHTRAFEHFCKAYDRTEQLSKIDEMKDVLRESRWRIDLMLSKGKAFYELGYFKRSLKWYIRAWKLFMFLTAQDSDLEIDIISTENLENWLEEIQYDPDIRKPELIKRLQPFVKELKTARVSPRLRGLAADILNRIGHNLFIMNLKGNWEKLIDQEEEKKEPRWYELNGLAFSCIELAKYYDERNTLVRAKQINILKDYLSRVKFPVDELLGDQWPFGGSMFERFSRVYEYYLLNSIVKSMQSQETSDELAQHQRKQQEIATMLLSYFMSHTDSNNTAKLSQIYRYLMRKRRIRPRFEKETETLRLEFICLRRYSSFFPFLPRPSAFNILGGGYFVRLHNSGRKGTEESKIHPFGIVIDPGSDFVENLYRSGFSLEDIDMIIVSHSHVDHQSCLEPLISLLHSRSMLGDKKFNNNNPLIILGNESITEQYKFYNEIEKYNIQVNRLSDEKYLPERIEANFNLSIKAYQGHHPDIGGRNACGIRISIGGRGGPSLGITSDTKNVEGWDDFFDSDVIIAHISSVPLSQLRAQSGVCIKGKSSVWLKELWEDIRRSDRKEDIRLRKQLEFSFWLNPEQSDNTDDLFDKIQNNYVPPGHHLYLDGIINLATIFQDNKKRSISSGLFVISELHEELGTFRTKIAMGLNKHIFKSKSYEPHSCKALTGDLGLELLIESPAQGKKRTRVLCSTCDIDNDATIEERYHDPYWIREVCVKGEDEGIFYNCHWHDPGTQPEPAFIERMERYDVFGRNIP